MNNQVYWLPFKKGGEIHENDNRFSMRLLLAFVDDINNIVYAFDSLLGLWISPHTCKAT